MSFLTDIAQVLWFLLPAIAANMAPVFAARYGWLKTLDKPIDGGLLYRGQPLLGSHKTIRGFVAGIVTGYAVGLAQGLLFRHSQAVLDLSLFDYSDPLLSGGIGSLLGFGALLGDAAKSFVKRRVKRTPGKSWPPFDQIDFVIGAMVVTWNFVRLTPPQIFIALTIIGSGSFVVSLIGKKLKIKKTL